MTRISYEQLVTTPSTLNYLADTAYDYTKWNIGKGIYYNAGGTAIDRYIAPNFGAIRPVEESTGFAAVYVDAVNFSSTYDYVFGLENSTAATNTRRVHMWTVNKKNNSWSWNGFITMTYLTATAHTARAFKIDRKLETTGQASASGTAVTGSGTSWVTNGVAVGARIGFGSTDPKAITTWYRITVVGATSLTIATSAGTVANGAYVIEEYRPVVLNTNATTTNGGIHLGKGITPEDFTSGGTTIGVAAAADGVKAMYWIKDNITTQTNIVAAGMDFDTASATPTSLTCYVSDLVSAGNYKFYTYNLRAALTVSTGASASPWLLATGNNPFTGTGSQNSNMRIATTAHGTGSGVKSIYIVTTTRWYRVPVTQITSTSTTVFSSPSDNITEIPPGGVNTFAATGALSTIHYSPTCDGFVVGSTHTGGTFSYITQYKNSGVAWDMNWGRDYKYLEQSTKDSSHPTIWSNQSQVASYGCSLDSNLVYAVKQGTTQSTNHIYMMAWGINESFANVTAGYLISPEISTPNALKYYRAFVNHISVIGSGMLRQTTQTFDVYVRTSNIRTDATSGWTLLDETNDISGFSGASAIQFKLHFKTIGEDCLPARILGLNLSYEDNTTDSHYAVSVGKSSLASKQFAFWFKTAWGSTVPTMTIRLYDADTGGLLVTDNTLTPTQGTFEKTTDGTSWGSYNTTDRANATTWIRYTPSSLADNIKVQAYFTQG
jgi:hypothetical protein